QVAIKVLHTFIAENDVGPRRFAREAQAIARLRHANVLQVHDYQAPSGDTPAYLVMELLSGPTLRQHLDAHGLGKDPVHGMPAEVAAMIGVKLAGALRAAHAQGIVHRDIKPEN